MIFSLFNKWFRKQRFIRAAFNARPFAATLCLLTAANCFAQNPSADQKQNSQAEDDPVVIRLTPAIARAIASEYSKNILVPRYELDASKVDEVTEVVARRFMEAAERVGPQGADFFNYLVPQIITMNTERGGNQGVTPELGKGVAEHLSPLIPNFRDLVRDVSNDVRPNLSIKNQLKLTADTALAGTAINAFESSMKRWQDGKAKPFENPFETDDNPKPVEREADGLSKDAKQAQKTAESFSKAGKSNTWKHYIEEAKKLYQFDSSQAATAESVLREYTQRADTMMKETGWSDNVYRRQLLYWIIVRTPRGWTNLVVLLLQQGQKISDDPLDTMETEFKGKIDEIPTAAQRVAADQQMNNLLAEKGISTTERTPSTEPTP